MKQDIKNPLASFITQKGLVKERGVELRLGVACVNKICELLINSFNQTPVCDYEIPIKKCKIARIWPSLNADSTLNYA